MLDRNIKNSDLLIFSALAPEPALLKDFLVDSVKHRENNQIFKNFCWRYNSLGSSDDEFHNYISQNVEEIGKESDRYTLTIANRLFYKKEFTMKEDYVNAVQTKYFGQLESFDSSQPTATAAV